MSILTEINRITNTKNAFLNYLKKYGVDIPYEEKIDTYINYFNELKDFDKNLTIQFYTNINNIISPSISYYFNDCNSRLISIAGRIEDMNLIKIGESFTNISNLFSNCKNLTGSPVCSDNVINIFNTYYNCVILKGSPVCGKNVTDMRYAYYNCRNLTGIPVCGNNVISMFATYYNCYNITGSPVCGENVTHMRSTYMTCSKLTGSPVCGNNVTDMYQTYMDCTSLTGSPVCGNNVDNMYATYRNCVNLTGYPVCGENVTNMGNTYASCTNIGSNGYFYSNKVSNMRNCFYGKNNSKRLNLYVPANSTTLNTCLISNTLSFLGRTIRYTNDYTTNGVYYNTILNVYIYPVDNVAAIREINGD